MLKKEARLLILVLSQKQIPFKWRRDDISGKFAISFNSEFHDEVKQAVGARDEYL